MKKILLSILILSLSSCSLLQKGGDGSGGGKRSTASTKDAGNVSISLNCFWSKDNTEVEDDRVFYEGVTNGEDSAGYPIENYVINLPYTIKEQSEKSTYPRAERPATKAFRIQEGDNSFTASFTHSKDGFYFNEANLARYKYVSTPIKLTPREMVIEKEKFFLAAHTAVGGRLAIRLNDNGSCGYDMAHTVAGVYFDALHTFDPMWVSGSIAKNPLKDNSSYRYECSVVKVRVDDTPCSIIWPQDR